MTLSSTDRVSPREVRKFGLLAGIFFGSLLGIGLWHGKSVSPLFFGTLSLLSWGLLAFPKRLMPLYKGWQRAGHLIGKGITLILMTAAYYLVMTPAAWIKNILGGRPLSLFPDKGCASYWLERTPSTQSKERFLKRF